MDGADQKSDVAIYQQVVAQMQQGDGYYTAVSEVHRATDYPLAPFYTVRPPTLATVHVFLGDGIYVLALLLVVITALAWHRRLADQPLAVRLLAVAAIGFFGGNGLLGVAIYIHDWWAGMLLSLALALQPRWIAVLAVAFLAALIRDLAVPFLLLVPFVYRTRPAVIAAAAAIVLLGGYYAYHANEVWQLVQPTDLKSTGWMGMRGPIAFFRDIATLNDLNRIGTIGTILAALPALGWLLRRDWLSLLWFIGVAGAVAIVSRPDNYYWAQLALPAYLLGVFMIPLGGWAGFSAAGSDQPGQRA